MILQTSASTVESCGSLAQVEAVFTYKEPASACVNSHINPHILSPITKGSPNHFHSKFQHDPTRLSTTTMHIPLSIAPLLLATLASGNRIRLVPNAGLDCNGEGLPSDSGHAGGPAD